MQRLSFLEKPKRMEKVGIRKEEDDKQQDKQQQVPHWKTKSTSLERNPSGEDLFL